ncbi:serine/threonine protein kinase [Tokyovirus A1]|uniref:serine/threonine protein kinase n=1 Tax=Tokyovirus A1 TaxID=1826170 RepID=UPI0007A969D0|nr:serine/threonine protein kinase [Tokyovirus A1]BAU80072.1 serine/threonine protein kinase [Tokyovirus A1]
MELIQKSSHPLQATITADREKGETYKTYVCKSFDSEAHPEKKIYDLFGEGHENICKLLRFERQNLSQTLVLEHLPFDLSRKHLDAEEIQKVFVDVCKGLEFLHKRGIIHADLKPSNILYDGKTAKLCDFGLSLCCGEEEIFVDNEVVTLHYRAPELLVYPLGPFGKGIDIWSLGCVLSELWSGKPLWCFDKALLICQHIRHKYIPHKQQGMPKKLGECLSELLRYYPKDRPTITQVLEKYC